MTSEQMAALSAVQYHAQRVRDAWYRFEQTDEPGETGGCVDDLDVALKAFEATRTLAAR